MTLRALPLAAASCACALPVLAEVNVHCTRQPAIIQPVIDVFTAQSGKAANHPFMEEGLIERVVVEGERPPVDLVTTVDIAKLRPILSAGMIASVQGEVLKATISAELRSPDDLSFALIHRARAAARRIVKGISFLA